MLHRSLSDKEAIDHTENLRYSAQESVRSIKNTIRHTVHTAKSLVKGVSDVPLSPIEDRHIDGSKPGDL